MTSEFIIFWLIVTCVILAIYSSDKKGENLQLRFDIDLKKNLESYKRDSNREQRLAYKQLLADYEDARNRLITLEQKNNSKKKILPEVDSSRLFGPRVGQGLSLDGSDLSKARWRERLLEEIICNLQEPNPFFISKTKKITVSFNEERALIRSNGKVKMAFGGRIETVSVRPKTLLVRSSVGPGGGDIVLSCSQFEAEDWSEICEEFKKLHARSTDRQPHRRPDRQR
jgi:hypothetical protein